MIWFVLVVLVLMLAGSVWLNVHTIRNYFGYGDHRENLVDTIEEALDVLDECYTSIAHAAEIPVLSDEPIIRDLLSDIRRTKNAVLAIAGKVVIYGEEKGAEKGE
jgi:hypothetical protein